MTCPDLCPAAKCAELEARISALEFALELLKAAFETHTQQTIPEAHEYNSNLKIDGSYQNEILNLTVADRTSQDTATIPIPLDHNHDVSVEITNSNNNETEIKVSVDDDSDNDTLAGFTSNLKLDGSVSNDVLFLTVADGNSQDTAEIPLPFEHDHDVRVFGSEIFSNGRNGIGLEVYVDDNSGKTSFPLTPPDNRVNVNTDIYDNTLIVDVTVGNENDFSTVNLPVFKPIVTVDISPNDDTFTIKVSVNGISDSDSFTIDISEMDFDEIIKKIVECCNQLSTKTDNTRNYLVAEIEESENNLANQIFIARNLLNQDIQDVEGKVEDVEGKVEDVEQWVTIDISGQTNSQYQCSVPLEDPDNPTSSELPLQSKSNYESVSYNGVGLQGIHENLKIINRNLDKIFESSCAGVNDAITVDLQDYLQSVCSDVNLAKREEFGSDNAFFDFVKDQLIDAMSGIASSKLLKLLKFTPSPGSVPSFVVQTTASWATTFLIEKALKQESAGITKLCEAEPQEVVTLVASEKELHRVDGKQLILAFVTLDNYPKRKRDSSWRPIHIPAPKESYDWNTDFKDLRWQQGNQYAELVLEGYKHGVSGWFEDQAAADSLFDAVLNFTTATEVNRLYPKHKNPKTAYTVRPSRPWRAYVSQVKTDGGAETLTTYFPDPNEES